MLGAWPRELDLGPSLKNKIVWKKRCHLAKSFAWASLKGIIYQNRNSDQPRWLPSCLITLFHRENSAGVQIPALPLVDGTTLPNSFCLYFSVSFSVK